MDGTTKAGLRIPGDIAEGSKNLSYLDPRHGFIIFAVFNCGGQKLVFAYMIPLTLLDSSPMMPTVSFVLLCVRKVILLRTFHTPFLFIWLTEIQQNGFFSTILFFFSFSFFFFPLVPKYCLRFAYFCSDAILVDRIIYPGSRPVASHST